MASPSNPNDQALPPYLMSAIRAGSFTGIGGLVIGGAYGTIYSSTPFLFSIAYGLQCFALGGIYWGCRGLLTQKTGVQSSREKVYTSAAAGGATGAFMSLLTRRRSSFLPGIIVLAAVGASGQGVFNMLDANHSQAQEDKTTQDDGNILQSIVKSGWTPFKVLTDEDYADMVRERILRLEAEIAVTKDEMKRVRDASIDIVEPDKN